MTTQSDPPFPVRQATAYVFKVEEFLDDVGRRVVERSIVWGEVPVGDDHVTYVGVSQVLVMMNGMEQPSPFRFPIVGVSSLQEAFDKWDAFEKPAGALHIALLRQTFARQQLPPDAPQSSAAGIALPSAAEAKAILGGRRG